MSRMAAGAGALRAWLMYTTGVAAGQLCNQPAACSDCGGILQGQLHMSQNGMRALAACWCCWYAGDAQNLNVNDPKFNSDEQLRLLRTGATESAPVVEAVVVASAPGQVAVRKRRAGSREDDAPEKKSPH